MDPVGTDPVDVSPRTREEFERIVTQLVEPLFSHFSPGNARVRPTATGAHFTDTAAELEGFARPLWGVVPLGVHAEFDHWPRFREGLVNGTDPNHDEYWGIADDYSQKHVEMASIGIGLLLTPDHLWEPLLTDEREQVSAWLNQINDAKLHDCNWLFFRVMVNLGLRSVGAPHDWKLTQKSLDRLDSFYCGDGWYTDGPVDDDSPVDYYLPWAMHFYGLVYATVAADPERADRFRARAEKFAVEHIHWFDDDGRAIPYGRSLTYRFAQAAFWGGLAFADTKPDSFSWSTIRGLWARNVRWWLDQPIFTDGGLLSVGYRYPTLKVSESYNSPNSPYWAMKAFFPLALDNDHPFWRAEERPLPDLPDVTTQSDAKKVFCRDNANNHLFALSLPQTSVHGHEKYTKFAYSTRFGFSVASRRPGPGRGGHDSALALSLDGEQYRTPKQATTTEVNGETLAFQWDPWEGVQVHTWLAPALPWHARVHRIETDRTIHVEEGGFALDRTDENTECSHHTRDDTAIARYSNGVSGIVDGLGDRTPIVVEAEPNTNLNHSRTVVPTLRQTCDSGVYWFGSAVMASPDTKTAVTGMPAFHSTDDGISVETHLTESILDCSLDSY